MYDPLNEISSLTNKELLDKIEEVTLRLVSARNIGANYQVIKTIENYLMLCNEEYNTRYEMAYSKNIEPCEYDSESYNRTDDENGKPKSKNLKRYINPDGKVELDLNTCVYAISCGAELTYIQLEHNSDYEREIYNSNCEKFGMSDKMVKYDSVDHLRNHNIWNYDAAYDNLNLTDYFHSKCRTTEEIERVDYELSLYEYYNMNRLLRCMIWLVDYMKENNIFWGIGRGSSVSSFCLYLIDLHMVDSLKYNLDVNEFLKY